MKLYNTLTKRIDEFKTLKPTPVTLYTCGPTVYDFTHIGHARKYINDDLLKRTLNYLGFKVKHVMNITDVGHLTSDEDAGEDKLEKGAKKAGKTVWEVAQFYTDFFLNSLKSTNVIMPELLIRATDHIQEMLQLINILKQKGFTYETVEAVYFDTSKFPGYGKLSGQKLEDKLKGAREDVYIDPNKKNATDFALWFKRVGRFKDHTMHWNSPYGEGFPGWHIECSAMSMKYLGETIDIHTGGIDHIPVHHEDEIAQSEAATGKQFVRFWVHYEFLLIEGQKMSKSLRNFFTLGDLQKKGIDPLALRYLYLQTHYRKQLNFTWESAFAAQETYRKLKKLITSFKNPLSSSRSMLSPEKLNLLDTFRSRFAEAILSDLQLPQAVAIMWEMLKSNIPSPDKLDLLFEFDMIFGLKLSETEADKIPEEILILAKKREEARKKGDFTASDVLRNNIVATGYQIEDLPKGFRIKKSSPPSFRA
ncbi:cysteine--tRNA ligase [Candidatus Roizmanbacteria bacterium RIFCSPHIGHO2_01_FULL_35_10]|uniref:Cysteine--tRNA ligase n=1 Tax=Candidatus Roizmanbacteria bacterium RIFCSPLOWO2_01_FULL_35_13 TaxID=1802055 RepID=A0A1F7IB19_9BACT|nr:MAG: cysteine--tRNA ligase [Candidatus Roizmanbacteria bacterium RIFCSPHIGHO2_01_FULL_35_10]OGK40532.1 MAG: cysteine--tRNA ligase [Candidatus Roizmanbacteria bacterium RIFCSPLOWO2_01_FULL_35_13]